MRKKRRNKVFTVTEEEFFEWFRKKLISEEVVKTIFPKKVTKVNGGIYCAVRSINTKIINLKNCTYEDILKQGFN